MSPSSIPVEATILVKFGPDHTNYFFSLHTFSAERGIYTWGGDGGVVVQQYYVNSFVTAVLPCLRLLIRNSHVCRHFCQRLLSVRDLTVLGWQLWKWVQEQHGWNSHPAVLVVVWADSPCLAVVWAGFPMVVWDDFPCPGGMGWLPLLWW